MGRPLAFDTNILIDFLRGISAAEDLIAARPNSFISVVSWIEVLAGTDVEQEAVVRAFLRRFLVIQLSPPVAARAFQVRRDTRLKLPDAIILAAAQVHGCTLLTRNTKDYFGRGFNVEFPYKV